jgi:hypothetical protein
MRGPYVTHLVHVFANGEKIVKCQSGRQLDVLVARPSLATLDLVEADPIGGDVLSRVRKLLDKAERTGNSHEADAFSRKAAELIARHRIDPERLASVRVGDELMVRQTSLGRGAYVRARLALLQAVADAHDVQVVFQATPTGTVALAAGYRSDLDVVDVMYHSLHQQAASQMASIRRGTGAATQRFRRSFLFGFASRLGDILSESRTAAEASVQSSSTSPEASSAQALAVQSRNAAIDDFASTAFGRVRVARRPSAAQPGGWSAGAAAAAGADVGRVRLSGRRAIGDGRS